MCLFFFTFSVHFRGSLAELSTMSSANSSDSEGRRRVVPYPRISPPPIQAPPIIIKPKKKKKSLPPQETINKIWSRFSAPKFSQATTILPFATAPSKTKATPPALERDNLLVSEDFEKAVQECRTRVKKLVRECKRVNMRYRDPEFDIDWDLKWAKGYCLNGLGGRKFDLTGRILANSSSKTPKSVKRVHEIFEKPTFLKDKVTPADVRQGSLGDCWLMASLTALSQQEVGLHRICVEYDTKVGIYGFVFHRDGEWIISIIDDKLYLKSPDWDSPSVQRHLLEQTDREDVENEYRRTYQTGSQALFFAHCADQNETWLPLLEKAYAKAHGDYAALAGGWIGEGLEDLTGGVTTELLTSDILDTDEFWENEILKVNKEFLFGCSTGLLDGGYGTRDGISEGHAYVIMEARELSTGQRLLKLRNPWGKGKKGQWEGAWSDGSKEFTPEAQIELGHKFGSDSVFWISYQDLLRKYQHFDRTRLFMDNPDWRTTQKWVSLDVPWKSQFQQMFKIVLKKESPVVLVLSQLDDRYFDGLQGQYNFRLQFRLHEADSPEEEDYIVRSHGNYLMERSVVAELKELSLGTYFIYIQVVADRDVEEPSVEDVVKKACRKKEENEKLAQVGASYDHAHRKAAIHLEATTAARKASDTQKAREARIAARKKNWETRHLQRNILRKQDKKNKEKRDLKSARDREASKAKENLKPKDVAVQTEDPTVLAVIVTDKGVQTEEVTTESDTNTIVPTPLLPETTMRDIDKAVQTDDLSDSLTAETPKSSSVENNFTSRMRSSRRGRDRNRNRNRSLSRSRSSSSSGTVEESVIFTRHRPAGPPPPPPPGAYRGGPPHRTVMSDGESSASPVEEYDDMYSEDDHDHTLKPRPIGVVNPGLVLPPPPGGVAKDSEEEDNVEPWNAVCIVGFRVYSLDSGLELVIYEEGEESTGKEKGIEGGAVDDGLRDVEVETNMKVLALVEVDLPVGSKEGQEGKEIAVLVDKEKAATGLQGEKSESSIVAASVATDVVTK